METPKQKLQISKGLHFKHTRLLSFFKLFVFYYTATHGDPAPDPLFRCSAPAVMLALLCVWTDPGQALEPPHGGLGCVLPHALRALTRCSLRRRELSGTGRGFLRRCFGAVRAGAALEPSVNAASADRRRSRISHTGREKPEDRPAGFLGCRFNKGGLPK